MFLKFMVELRLAQFKLFNLHDVIDFVSFDVDDDDDVVGGDEIVVHSIKNYDSVFGLFNWHYFIEFPEDMAKPAKSG